MFFALKAVCADLGFSGFDLPYIRPQIKEDKLSINMACTDDQVLILDKEKTTILFIQIDFPNNLCPLKINCIRPSSAIFWMTLVKSSELSA